MSKHVTVRDAHTSQADGATYVDVRSVPEFALGHPAGALNVPLLHQDPSTGRMTPNQHFLAVMQANFALDAPLLIGCQVGGRSAQAAQVLATAGFQHVANVLGGFGGAPGAEGWVQAGLPVATEKLGASYQPLMARATGGT